MGHIDNKLNNILLLLKDHLIVNNETYQKQFIAYLKNIYSIIPKTTEYSDLRFYLNNYINKTSLLSVFIEDIIVELNKHITW